MIILSQDEEKIINFDNIKALVTVFYPECVGIKALLGKESDILLGMYKDEPRAKEVLKDIIKAIAGENFVEYNESTLNIHSIEQKVFYMPKE